jgi:hypothetical protein
MIKLHIATVKVVFSLGYRLLSVASVTLTWRGLFHFSSVCLSCLSCPHLARSFFVLRKICAAENLKFSSGPSSAHCTSICTLQTIKHKTSGVFYILWKFAPCTIGGVVNCKGKTLEWLWNKLVQEARRQAGRERVCAAAMSQHAAALKRCWHGGNPSYCWSGRAGCGGNSVTSVGYGSKRTTPRDCIK